MVLPRAAALRGEIPRTVSTDTQRAADQFGVDCPPDEWAMIEEEINRSRFSPGSRKQLFAVLNDVRNGQLE